MRSLLESLEPAVTETRTAPGDKVENAMRANAGRAAAILTHVEPVLKAAVRAGSLMVVAARYDLSTGKVELLKPAGNGLAKE